MFKIILMGIDTKKEHPLTDTLVRFYVDVKIKNGSGGGSRTHDLTGMNRTL